MIDFLILKKEWNAQNKTSVLFQRNFVEIEQWRLTMVIVSSWNIQGQTEPMTSNWKKV